MTDKLQVAAYKNILERIKKACLQAKRDAAGVELVAVSKGQELDKIKALHALGHRLFGESYLDELVTKAAYFAKSAADIEWVFLGRLQSNKIQKIVQIASQIQSLSSAKHARYIQKYAKALSKTPYPVYIQLNPTLEPTKAGVSFAELFSLVEFIEAETPDLSLQGIMVLPPPLPAASGESIVQAQKLYKELRRAADKVGQGRLSLGMSQDLDLAILSGSDTVRVGRDLFGQRAKKYK
jgi:PLP dependent protein